MDTFLIVVQAAQDVSGVGKKIGSKSDDE